MPLKHDVHKLLLEGPNLDKLIMLLNAIKLLVFSIFILSVGLPAINTLALGFSLYLVMIKNNILLFMYLKNSCLK